MQLEMSSQEFNKEEEIKQLKQQIQGVKTQVLELQNGLKEKDKNKSFEATKEKFSNLIDDLGMIEVVSSAPTHTPVHPLKRLVLYVNGATKRLYIWDTENNTYYYCALT